MSILRIRSKRSPAIDSAWAQPQGSTSRFTRTRCDRPAVTSWLTTASIPEACRPNLGHKNIQHTTQVVYCLERVPAVVCGATASLWDCSSNFRYPSIQLQTFRCVILSDATGQHRTLASRRSSCVTAFSFVGSHYCTVEDADRTAL
jgi:hypothetical protein